MPDKIKVSKIVIAMGGKEVELSLDEARELKQLLDSTFGEKEIVYIPGTPIYVERPNPYPWQRWTVSWGTTTSSHTDDSEIVYYSLNG